MGAVAAARDRCRHWCRRRIGDAGRGGAVDLGERRQRPVPAVKSIVAGDRDARGQEPVQADGEQVVSSTPICDVWARCSPWGACRVGRTGPIGDAGRLDEVQHGARRQAARDARRS